MTSCQVVPYTNDIEGTQTPDSKQETNDMDKQLKKVAKGNYQLIMNGVHVANIVFEQRCPVSFNKWYAQLVADCGVGARAGTWSGDYHCMSWAVSWATYRGSINKQAN